jgi:hypothetical protein
MQQVAMSWLAFGLSAWSFMLGFAGFTNLLQ